MNKELYQKALQIINFSPQTEKNLKIKLFKKQFSEEEIDEVIEKLKEDKYLDDNTYAELYADELVRIKFAGVNKIIQKLLGKGIKRNLAIKIANDSIENNGGEDQIIEKFIKKHLRFFQSNYYAQNNDKIQRKLINNGFKNIRLSNITRILENINNNENI